MARAPAVIETEALPEVDRLDGYPHPRETPTVYGHASAERALVAAIATGRMHHAWLLTGRMGIGKATLAYRLARFLLASQSDRTQPETSLDVAPGSIADRQVLSLSHPGLLVLRRPWMPTTKRFGTSIPIDEVRRLRGFLGHTAAEGTWRVVIVDTADDLNPNAANALLKSLEEPPVRTVFILLASEPGRLLPTIRSRCRVLPLAPLGLDDLRHAASLAAEGRDISFAQMEPLADGSVRRLLELSDGTGAKLHERIQAILSALPKIDWSAAHALADELGSPAADQRFETFFTVLLSVLANAIRNAAAGRGEGSAAWSIPSNRTPAWAEMWETIGRDKEEAVELNLDRRALILSTLSRLAAVARA